MMATKNSEVKTDNKGGFGARLKNVRELNLFLVVVAVILIMSFTSKFFPQWTNIRVILSALSVDGIVVIGMTLILIVGGIDLSVGSVLCFAMTVCGLLFKGGMDPWIAALIAILVCALIGLIMGLLVTKLKLTHFIVSLAFMGMIRGLVLILSTGTPISIVAILNQHPLFLGLGQGKLFGDGTAFPTQFPVQVIIFVVIALIADYIVRHSSSMRIVFYTGSNPKAAEYSGINTQKTIIIVGVLCSTLAGLAGIIYLSKFSGVPMSAGEGLEMTALSAAVIGGASLTGGKGTIFGSILGLVLMQLVTNALTLYHISTFWHSFISYTILLIAVVLDQAQQLVSRRRTA